MNDRTRTLRAILKRRGQSLMTLSKAAAVHHKYFMQVLAGTRCGRHVWKRIQIVTSPEEQREIVKLYGPVFGEDWVDELAPD
jgi:hypothetical protein